MKESQREKKKKIGKKIKLGSPRREKAGRKGGKRNYKRKNVTRPGK